MKEIATISIGIGNIKQRPFYHRRPEGNLLDRRITERRGALNLCRADACAPFGFGFRRIFPPKCFAFLRRISKIGAEIIPGLFESIRKATTERREYGKEKTATGATAKGRK